jgi:hypothetical protein
MRFSSEFPSRKKEVKRSIVLFYGGFYPIISFWNRPFTGDGRFLIAPIYQSIVDF